MSVTRVGIRELKSRLSSYMQQVKAGTTPGSTDVRQAITTATVVGSESSPPRSTCSVSLPPVLSVDAS